MMCIWVIKDFETIGSSQDDGLKTPHKIALLTCAHPDFSKMNAPSPSTGKSTLWQPLDSEPLQHKKPTGVLLFLRLMHSGCHVEIT